MFDEELAKLAVEPPRRVESLPGLRLSAAVPKWMLLVPLFFLSFFAIIPLSIMSADPAMRLSMGRTELSQGRVVSTVGAWSCRGSASRRVTYAFSSTSGREYRGAATLCERSLYYSVNAGDAIEVRYLESDPTVNVLPSEGMNGAPPVALFFFMPVFFFAIFGSMFWPPIGEVLRARRVFKRGRLANGKVVFVKRRATPIWPGISNNGAAEVFIEFQTSSQEKREGVAACRNEWLINQLKPGERVHVAYLNDKAGSVALLEAYLR